MNYDLVKRRNEERVIIVNEILRIFIIYFIGVMVALKMIENMCKEEELDYPMVFFVCASSWVAVFLLIGKIILNKVTNFIRRIWIRK